MQVSKLRAHGAFNIGRLELSVAVDLDCWSFFIDADTDVDGAIMHYLQVGPFSVSVAFMPDHT
jgi:hypothetical protein